MPDDTDILGLPLILPAQAQKHVTHNEALAALDVIVQLSVINRTLTVPPVLATIGDRHIVPAGATLDWAGQAGKVAVFAGTGWQFHAPLPGWRAHVLAEGQTAVFDGLVWKTPSESAASFGQLGVSATADATNRLSVSAPATLLNHAGAGHQLKLNKALATDTASLLFQTGFSGRVEMGTTGSDNFEVKTSANGTAWTTALTVAGASGTVAFGQAVGLANGTAPAPALGFASDSDTGLYQAAPDVLGIAAGGVQVASFATAGATVNVPVTGSAVTQLAQDATPGRLLKVGDGGINLMGAVNYIPDIDLATISQGLWQTDGGAPGSLGVFPAGQNRYGHLLNFRVGTAEVWQVYKSIVGRRIFSRARSAGVWSGWEEIFHAGSILGTVSQSAGVPTGRVIERGTNANGEYVRFADGTQICTRTNLSFANSSTALGSLFRSSANVTWTFPAAFIAAPVVTGDVDDADCWLVTAGAPVTTSASLRATSAVTKAAALNSRAVATGRWF